MKFATFAACLAVGVLGASAANAAQVFNIEVWLQGAVPSANNLADPAHVPGGPASVTFNWDGGINWSDTSPQNGTPAGGIAGDLLDGFGSQASNYASSIGLSQADFLARSLTIAGDSYTTFFRISTTYVSASVINGSFVHDDGATIYVDGVFAGGFAPETSQRSDNFTLAAGMHNLTAYYVTGNGTPSILSFNPQVTTFQAGIPEPATWAFMLTGFFGAGALLRRRRAEAAAA